MISGYGFVDIYDIREGGYWFCDFIIILVFDDGTMAYKYINDSSFYQGGSEDHENMTVHSDSLISTVREHDIHKLAKGFISACETDETEGECIDRITKEMIEHGVKIIK